jgi:hypothetical protein
MWGKDGTGKGWGGEHDNAGSGELEVLTLGATGAALGSRTHKEATM